MRLFTFSNRRGRDEKGRYIKNQHPKWPVTVTLSLETREFLERSTNKSALVDLCVETISALVTGTNPHELESLAEKWGMIMASDGALAAMAHNCRMFAVMLSDEIAQRRLAKDAVATANDGGLWWL